MFGGTLTGAPWVGSSGGQWATDKQLATLAKHVRQEARKNSSCKVCREKTVDLHHMACWLALMRSLQLFFSCAMQLSGLLKV
jgi:hypothetical protein